MLPHQLEEGEVREMQIDPRIYICSFPKSGTHLVEQLVRPICVPMPADKPWAGAFRDHSWTVIWDNSPNILRRIGYIRDGTYAKGHMGYKEEIELFLYGASIATLFVYRDPRDVALSQAHHILSGSMHSHNEWYQEMGFDATLLACITGMHKYAGVMQRWNEYAGWLERKWVLPLKFEDIIENKEEQCKRVVEYSTTFMAQSRGYEIEIPDEVMGKAVAAMVKNSERKEDSLTFRKGKSGGWREEFMEGHIQAFKYEDSKWAEEYGLEESWLVHLGYEEDDDWGVGSAESVTEEVREHFADVKDEDLGFIYSKEYESAIDWVLEKFPVWTRETKEEWIERVRKVDDKNVRSVIGGENRSV